MGRVFPNQFLLALVLQAKHSFEQIRLMGMAGSNEFAPLSCVRTQLVIRISKQEFIVSRKFKDEFYVSIKLKQAKRESRDSSIEQKTQNILSVNSTCWLNLR